jgi:hypothetical protein
LKKAKQIALDNSILTCDSYKKGHDFKSATHTLTEGDFLYGQSVICGQKQKFGEKWIGLYLVTRVINQQNVEKQLSHKK